MEIKLGFNEATSSGCKNHSIMKDLELCEELGFDYIDIQNLCLDRELESGKITLEAISEWLDCHNLKVLSYNALSFFNMKQTQKEKDDVMALLDEVIERCKALRCHRIVVVPSVDLPVKATVAEIRKDAVEVLKQMLDKVRPHGIKLALEFCGSYTMSINRYEDAYEIVKEVNDPLLGLTIDDYNFHAMGSSFEELKKVDGNKIFVWHLNGCEDFPCGSPYTNDESRTWPEDPKDCIDHSKFTDIIKSNGFDGECAMIEIWRSEYYSMSQEENVKKAYECTKAFVEKYF